MAGWPAKPVGFVFTGRSFSGEFLPGYDFYSAVDIPGKRVKGGKRTPVKGL
jgi:hypothetical protein